MLLNKNKKIFLFIIAALLCANALIWHAIFVSERRVLTVSFLDVGQGDAIFIETPRGAQMLVDGGGGRQVLRALGSVMSFYDKSIDVIVGTHPDQDHIGGLSSVLERYNVSFVLDTGMKNDTAAFRAFENGVAEERKRGAREVSARRGMTLLLDDETRADILWPNRDTNGWDTNDASIVIKLTYKETSILLTGDLPKRIEQYLAIEDGSKLKSNILKAGHHGSRTSSDTIFLSAVTPEEVVISAGENNRYGHPHKEVLDLLSQMQVPFLSTAILGTITFASDGTRFWRTK